jgi:hypothetical protein
MTQHVLDEATDSGPVFALEMACNCRHIGFCTITNAGTESLYNYSQRLGGKLALIQKEADQVEEFWQNGCESRWKDETASRLHRRPKRSAGGAGFRCMIAALQPVLRIRLFVRVQGRHRTGGCRL